MFDGERRDLRVGDEIAAQLVGGYERSEDPGMALGGIRDPDRVPGQPVFNVSPRGMRRQRTFRSSWMRGNADERPQDLPRQTHPLRPVQNLRQPGTCACVKVTGCVDREEQDVGVYEHQRVVGSSSSSSASATLVTSI